MSLSFVSSSQQLGVVAPEFVTSAQAETVFGLGKSFLYLLKSENKIKSVCIRKRGAARGKRLWSCDSIRAYLLANTEEASSSMEAR